MISYFVAATTFSLHYPMTTSCGDAAENFEPQNGKTGSKMQQTTKTMHRGTYQQRVVFNGTKKAVKKGRNQQRTAQARNNSKEEKELLQHHQNSDGHKLPVIFFWNLPFR